MKSGASENSSSLINWLCANMYAESEYMLGRWGKPVSVAETIATKYISPVSGTFSSPSKRLTRDFVADANAENKIDDNRHKKPGFWSNTVFGALSWRFPGFSPAQKSLKSAPKLRACKIGVRGNTVAKKRWHNFSQMSLRGKSATMQEIVYLLPQSLHLLEWFFFHETSEERGGRNFCPDHSRLSSCL